MLEYDNSAFYYFGITVCTIYVLPSTYFALKRIIFGCFFTDHLLDKYDVRCEKELKKIRKLQEEKTKLKNIFTIYFIMQIMLIVFGWFFLYQMIQLVQGDSEIKTFDPFAILNIDNGASDKDIKKAYRKMSLLYHPDKNIGDAVAEQKFMLVAKAYEALTDEVAKENYEKYGNPDGRQALQLSIGLPTFLLEKENHNLILLIYLIILVIVIPSIVALWYSKSKKYGDSMIMYDSYGFYNYALSEHSHIKMMAEILAGSAEFRDIPHRHTDGPQLTSLLKKLRENPLMSKPRFNHPAILKANVLLHAHIFREDIPCNEGQKNDLRNDLNIILKQAPHLIDGMIEISTMKAWLQTTINIVEFQQYVTQALFTKSSSLLTIPHVSESDIKHLSSGKNSIKTLQQFLDLDKEAQQSLLEKISGGDKAILKEMEAVIKIIPNIEVTINVGVEDEDQIAEGDIMTISIHLTRKNLSDDENETCDLVYAPHFPFPKSERWYVIIGDPRSNHLHSFSKITSQNKYIQEKVQMQAPPKAGSYSLECFIKSDSYLGLDHRQTVKFNVVSADYLPAYVPHPEDVELDNEPTLFEQVMSGASLEDSSDEEEDSNETGKGNNINRDDKNEKKLESSNENKKDN